VFKTLRSLFGLETKSSLALPDAVLLDLLGAVPSAAGVRVTPRTAMACAPVACAVNAISQAIGQLPVHTYKRGTDDARDRATDHPAYKLLRSEANPWTPASKFREEVTRDALLHPNGGFAKIIRVDEGKPFELIRLDPEVTPVTVKQTTDGPVYTIQEDGKTLPIDRQDILHIPSPTPAGLAHDAREAIGICMIMERYRARMFANGVRPGSLLIDKSNKTGSADSSINLKRVFEASFRGDGVGGVAALHGDIAYHQLTLSSVDAQYLELCKLQIDEIARFFRVPPHMLYEMGRATWGNSEEQRQTFLDLTLSHWIGAWEGELRLKLFSEDERDAYYAEFNVEAFVRANYAAQMEGLTKAIAARILNPNEARAKLNLPPYAAGKEFINPNVQTAVAA
jgi:HK97 family phage portal protein